MAEIYRRGIPVEACSTLTCASIDLGGKEDLLRWHKNNSSGSFPNPVARFGTNTLYVFAELEAFYRSVLWRQADGRIKDLLEGGDAA